MLSKSSTYTTCKAVWPEIANFDFCASLMIQASPSLPITQYKFMKYWTQTFFNVLHNFPSGTIYFRAQDKDGILLMSAFCVYCCCSPLFLSSVLMAHLNKALNVSRLSILIFVLNFFHYDTFYGDSSVRILYCAKKSRNRANRRAREHGVVFPIKGPGKEVRWSLARERARWPIFFVP